MSSPLNSLLCLPKEGSCQLISWAIVLDLLLTQKHLHPFHYQVSARGLIIDWVTSKPIDCELWKKDWPLLIENQLLHLRHSNEEAPIQVTCMSYLSWIEWARSKGHAWLEKFIFFDTDLEFKKHKSLQNRVIDVISLNDSFYPIPLNAMGLLDETSAISLPYAIEALHLHQLNGFQKTKNKREQRNEYCYRLELMGFETKKERKKLNSMKRASCSYRSTLSKMNFQLTKDSKRLFYLQSNFVKDLESCFSDLHVDFSQKEVTHMGKLPIEISASYSNFIEHFLPQLEKNSLEGLRGISFEVASSFHWPEHSNSILCDRSNRAYVSLCNEWLFDSSIGPDYLLIFSCRRDEEAMEFFVEPFTKLIKKFSIQSPKLLYSCAYGDIEKSQSLSEWCSESLESESLQGYEAALLAKDVYGLDYCFAKISAHSVDSKSINRIYCLRISSFFRWVCGA